MPITQSRMIALINAALDYKRALEQICDHIAVQSASINSGRITPQQALETIFISAQGKFLLGNPIESPVTITSEAHHFKLNKRRNERQAEKQRVRRGGGNYNPNLAPRQPLSHSLPPPSLFEQSNAGALLSQEQTIPDILDLKNSSYPSSLSPDDQATIQAESHFRVRPGYTMPENICLHEHGKAGQTCQDCGGTIPPIQQQ